MKLVSCVCIIFFWYIYYVVSRWCALSVACAFYVDACLRALRGKMRRLWWKPSRGIWNLKVLFPHAVRWVALHFLWWACVCATQCIYFSYKLTKLHFKLGSSRKNMHDACVRFGRTCSSWRLNGWHAEIPHVHSIFRDSNGRNTISYCMLQTQMLRTGCSPNITYNLW